MNPGTLQFKTIAVALDLTGRRPRRCATRKRWPVCTTRRWYWCMSSTPSPTHFRMAPLLCIRANAAAAAELKRMEEETSALGIPVHSVIESGVVCERILQALSEHHADLLLLGTRAKTEAGRVALGTIARQLLARSRCPIMTISPDALNSLPWAGCWRHVLAATDFSPASVRALQCAHQIALRQLVLLHVRQAEWDTEDLYCRERLRFLAPFNESHTVPVEHIVASGPAGKLIAEYAERFGADLVVLGSPENELGEKDFATSTVLQVISKVKCPVLCLPFAVARPSSEAEC